MLHEAKLAELDEYGRLEQERVIKECTTGIWEGLEGNLELQKYSHVMRGIMNAISKDDIAKMTELPEEKTEEDEEEDDEHAEDDEDDEGGEEDVDMAGA
ncbi:hypothetical protein K402DRAFT_397349 [Aulographum hederae CBS 113979]|uniref:Uncharacterized protein n=1 Tax=Aulographum hederae CBS 113979 TaxID=1176131 RepID=A0A6G1GPG1_9PEZI|nr:hypothetical protein K402DRAFT_397349 [Aulographum hederae CBS 113979]